MHYYSQKKKKKKFALQILLVFRSLGGSKQVHP